MNIKRTLSMLLVLATLLTLLPLAAFAAPAEAIGDQVTVASTGAAHLNKTKLTLVKGNSYQLRQSTSRSCKWSSSDKTVATVSSTGKVKAVGYGTCTITCRLSNGTKLKCTVKVVQKVGVAVDFVLFNKCCIKVVNRSTSRAICWLKTKVKEYNSSGVLTKTKYVTGDLPYSTPAKGTEYYTFNVQSSTTKVKVSVVEAHFTNGAVWRP